MSVVVRREEEVAGAGRKDDDTPLLHMARRPAANIGLADPFHRDRRLNTGRNIELLERVLNGKRVDHRGQHSHVVGPCPVESLRRAGNAPEDVAAADDEADLDAGAMDFGNVQGDALKGGRIDFIAVGPHEGLVGDLQ